LFSRKLNSDILGKYENTFFFFENGVDFLNKLVKARLRTMNYGIEESMMA
jgi:hypothetical protein